MKKYQKILVFIVIGFITFPAVVLGGTFVSSLIQGKSVPEAIETLAEQIEMLIGRVDVVETKQTEQEQIILQLQKQNSCLEKDVLLQKAKSVLGSIGAKVFTFEEIIEIAQQYLIGVEFYECEKCAEKDRRRVLWQNRLNEVKIIKEQYLEAEALCNG